MEKITAENTERDRKVLETVVFSSECPLSGGSENEVKTGRTVKNDHLAS